MTGLRMTNRSIFGRRGRKSRGFTLVELIVVLTIIALLAAVGVATALGSITLEECEKLPTISAFAHYDFTIDARGDSMEPSIQNGDTLYCRWCGLNTVISRPNRFYIVDTPEGAVVKQIKVMETCIICESLNAKYEPFKIEIVDDMRFAIVVGHSRKYE